ncbi:MAG: hypothetical protein ACK5L6_05700 [Anaerorhabdus sp.]|uniref:hypothetical protein n=1 Tax=Anaerorhabdus sp. TaxID=1872524 RepID=UPI003A86D953
MDKNDLTEIGHIVVKIIINIHEAKLISKIGINIICPINQNEFIMLKPLPDDLYLIDVLNKGCLLISCLGLLNNLKTVGEKE